MSDVKQLQQNALSKLDITVMAIAGSAPAYSISASTAALIGAVGLLGPGSILYAAISMFGIALAMMFLNNWRSDAGASYAWVGRSMNPSLGFMSGWALLVATVLFMIAGSLPVGSATLDLFAPSLTNNVVAVTVVGAIWFLAMNILTMLGMHTTARFQMIMTIIEVVGLLVIAIGLFVKFSLHPVHPFSWSWFAPTKFTFGTFMAGSLVAVFYYWGWDVTANLTEETTDRNRASGIAGTVGMVGILILFELLQVGFQMGLSSNQINQASSNLLPFVGNLIFPRPWGDIAILAVMVSTISTLETSLLQATRTLYSMGRDRVMGVKFAELHPRFKTPWLASVVIGILAIIIFVLTSFSSGINAIMTDAINAIGLQIAFYYGLTGFASAWYYRKSFKRNFKALFLKGIWPFASAAFLWFVAIYDIPQLGVTTDSIGLGAIVIGIIPLIYYRLKYRSDFYTASSESCSTVAEVIELSTSV